jgi:hypothetical protein
MLKNDLNAILMEEKCIQTISAKQTFTLYGLFFVFLAAEPSVYWKLKNEHFLI